MLNKILRRIWNLPFNSHTRIVHCVSRIDSLKKLIYSHFCRLYPRALCSSNVLQSVFSFSSSLMFGYNLNCGSSQLTEYSEVDFDTADWICYVRQLFGLYSPFEDFVYLISTL